MAGHLLASMQNKNIVMQEYLCDCEECLCLKFLSCIKNTSKFIKNKNNGTVILKIVC